MTVSTNGPLVFRDEKGSRRSCSKREVVQSAPWGKLKPEVDEVERGYFPIDLTPSSSGGDGRGSCRSRTEECGFWIGFTKLGVRGYETRSEWTVVTRYGQELMLDQSRKEDAMSE